jgi:acyl-coenzyme A thioesterase PaaI-like protein
MENDPLNCSSLSPHPQPLSQWERGENEQCCLAEGESFTTLELKINVLKPIWQARLRAIGRVLKQGRTVGLVECDITDENGNLVARTSSTCMTLRGEQAKGR